MSVSDIRTVELIKDSPSALAFAKLGFALRFDCHDIDESHSFYLRVRVAWQPANRTDLISTCFMIPHRDVALVALNLPPRPI